MSEKVNILLVDDQPAKLLSYEAILGNLEANLIKANSGKEALEFLLKLDIAVVLVDVCMPHLDGFELAGMIRQHPRFQKTAVILVSAVHMTDLDRLKGYDCGAVDYVSVPIVPEVLRAKVGVFAELYQKTRELEQLNTELEERVRARTTDLEQLAEERSRLLESERSARNEAERATRMKDEFLATLSHELRTPLNSILGWAQLLCRGKATVADMQKGLETIERNARVQSQLVNDLFEVNRIMSGKTRLEMRTVDVKSAIDTALETVRPSAETKSIELHKYFEDEAFFVKGDSGRLQQIVCNLLSNAIKFTPRGGKVDVTLEPEVSGLKIQVRDTGQGINRDFLPYVFDRFRQADSSITRKFGGLGLGLAIVKHLTELHGGVASAESAGEGKGSTFTIHLPRKAAKFADGEASFSLAISSDQHSGDLPSLKGMRILAVDDEEDVRLLIHRVLEETEADVQTAASAEEALQILRKSKPDVLVCDISMPDMDGYELMRVIRGMESENGANGHHIPAVALTAFARQEDQQRALDAGYHLHLAKPIEPYKLVNLLSNFVKHTVI